MRNETVISVQNGVESLKLRRGQKENSCVCVINKGNVIAQGGETSCPGLAVCPRTEPGTRAWAGAFDTSPHSGIERVPFASP